MAKRTSKRAKKPLELLTDVEAEVIFEGVPGQRKRAKRIDGKRLRLPRGIRYWFTARSVAGDLDVILGNERTIKELAGCVAVTLPDMGLVAIDEEAPLLRIVIGLIHELYGHGVMSAPGADIVNARVFCCSVKRAPIIEEHIATHAAPLWTDMLLRSGLLRLPPIPRHRRREKR
jgi:hypothetical protein